MRININESKNVSFFFSDLLPAKNGEAETMRFLQQMIDILLKYVVDTFDRSNKVIDFHYPNELLQEYNWELSDQPQSLEGILLNCKTTLKYAVKTGRVSFLFFYMHGMILYG